MVISGELVQKPMAMLAGKSCAFKLIQALLAGDHNDPGGPQVFRLLR